jgi:hypothetical protein
LLRAAIDAVVAGGYGLERGDYRHILMSFNHKIHSSEQCLLTFDALLTEGAESFYRRHDPFDNVSLVNELSHPDSESPAASATLMPSMAADRMPPA